MRLSPQATIDAPARRRGMRALTIEVAFSTTADAFMTGVIMTAFALELGASNTAVGALAAVTSWAQLLQGPGALLVERLRRRKLIAVTGSLVSAVAPAILAAAAIAGGSYAARMTALAAVALYFGAGAIAGCAWNAWVRDLVPDSRRGRFFGRRSTLSTAVSLAAGLLAAWLLERFPAGSIDRELVFAALFGLAFMAQLASAAALTAPPEPEMPPAPGRPARLRSMLRRPLADVDFRRLIAFLASWQFAVNLAQPFFTVFLLKQLGYGMTFVMALTLTSQLARMLTLSRWGVLADRFSSKSVLNVAAPAYILCIAGMIGASQLASQALVGAYLVALYLLMGVAWAGVSLATGDIVMRMSPHGSAQSYLAANGLLTAAAAGLAPLLGGLCADMFAKRHLSLALEWSGPRYQGDLLRLSLREWDFYFLLSALLGLYALHRLAMVREEGELTRRAMVAEMINRARDNLQRFTPLADLHKALRPAGGPRRRR